MLPSFVATRDASKKAKSYPKAISAKTSSGKENRPIQKNNFKSTRIPGSVTTPSKAVPQQKFNQAKAKNNGSQGVKKNILTQKSSNTVNVKTNSKLTVKKDENDDFQVDPAARQSIFTGMSPMISGRPERNTIGVSISRKLEQAQPKCSRTSFHAGFRNGGLLPTVNASSSAGLSLKRGFALSSAAKAEFNATYRKTTHSALSYGGISLTHAALEDFRAHSNILSTVGPIRRPNIKGMQRNKPYRVDQEQFGHRRKNDSPRKLTFEQRLSIIINDRPGLNGDRNIKQAMKQNPDFASCLPQTGTNRVASSPLEDTTNRIGHQNEDVRPSAYNATCGRSQPKLPGKLCEVTFISPRKKPQANKPSSARKSPCKRLHELSSAKETAPPLPCTPTRFALGKLKPGLRSGACRYTAEALDSLRKGLPLPPVDRRFEYYDEIKARSATPKRTVSKDGEEAGVSHLKDVTSSAKVKKSVRWADKSDNGKPSAFKHLNFDAVTEQKGFHTQPPNEWSHVVYSTSAAIPQTPTTRDVKSIIESTKAISISKQLPKPFATVPDQGVMRPDVIPSDWNSAPEESRSNALTRIINPAQLRRINTTPESNTKRMVPNGPGTRRTWARTPYARDEQQRREQSAVENTTDRVSDLSENTGVIREHDEAKSGFQELTDRILGRKRYEAVGPTIDELRQKFDLSRGIWQVMDDINKLCIREDINRVFACKLNLTGIQTSNPNDRVKCLPDENRHSRVEFACLQKPDCSSSSANDRTLCNSTKSMPLSNSADDMISDKFGDEQFVKYLSSLPEPSFGHRNHLGKRAGNESTTVVYSTARSRPICEGLGVSSSEDSIVCPVVTSSQVNGQAYAKTHSTSSNDSRFSSQSDLSSGYYSQDDTGSKISAMVHNFMHPIRKIIDDAFASHTTPHESIVQRGPVPISTPADDTLKQSQALSSNGTSAFTQIPSKCHNGKLSKLKMASTHLDAEVDFYTKYLEIAQRMGIRKIATRSCTDPVAKLLNNEDYYHFIPIED